MNLCIIKNVTPEWIWHNFMDIQSGPLTLFFNLVGFFFAFGCLL